MNVSGKSDKYSKVFLDKDKFPHSAKNKNTTKKIDIKQSDSKFTTLGVNNDTIKPHKMPTKTIYQYEGGAHFKYSYLVRELEILQAKIKENESREISFLKTNINSNRSIDPIQQMINTITTSLNSKNINRSTSKSSISIKEDASLDSIFPASNKTRSRNQNNISFNYKLDDKKNNQNKSYKKKMLHTVESLPSDYKSGSMFNHIKGKIKPNKEKINTKKEPLSKYIPFTNLSNTKKPRQIINSKIFEKPQNSNFNKKLKKAAFPSKEKSSKTSLSFINSDNDRSKNQILLTSEDELTLRDGRSPSINRNNPNVSHASNIENIQNEASSGQNKHDWRNIKSNKKENDANIHPIKKPAFTKAINIGNVTKSKDCSLKSKIKKEITSKINEIEKVRQRIRSYKVYLKEGKNVDTHNTSNM